MLLHVGYIVCRLHMAAPDVDQPLTLLLPVAILFLPPSPAAVLLLLSRPSITFTAPVIGLLLRTLLAQQHTNRSTKLNMIQVSALLDLF